MVDRAKADVPIAAKVVTVVSFAVLVCGLLFAVLHHGNAPKTKSKDVFTLNRNAVRLSAFMISDDLKATFTGQDSVLGGKNPGEALVWTQIFSKTTGREYEMAYDDNEIAADNKFKNKRLLIDSRVLSVEKDFTGEGYLTLLGVGSIPGVHAMLTNDSMAEAATFRRGQSINLVCTGAGLVAEIALLTDCRPIDLYMDTLTPSLEARVTDFLEGKITLSQNAAQTVVFTYVLGTSLPPGSLCLERNKADCIARIGALSKNKQATDAMRDQTKKILAPLKISP